MPARAISRACSQSKELLCRPCWSAWAEAGLVLERLSESSRQEHDSFCCRFVETPSSLTVWFGLRPELVLYKRIIPASHRGLITVHRPYLRLLSLILKRKVLLLFSSWGLKVKGDTFLNVRASVALKRKSIYDDNIWSVYMHYKQNRKKLVIVASVHCRPLEILVGWLQHWWGIISNTFLSSLNYF